MASKEPQKRAMVYWTTMAERLCTAFVSCRSYPGKQKIRYHCAARSKQSRKSSDRTRGASFCWRASSLCRQEAGPPGGDGLRRERRWRDLLSFEIRRKKVSGESFRERSVPDGDWCFADGSASRQAINPPATKQKPRAAGPTGTQSGVVAQERKKSGQLRAKREH
jgi:hypothetical protein